MKLSYGESRKVIDYVFWISLILFTNPGGILQAFGEDSGDGGINVTDILFAILGICFVFIYNRNYYKEDKRFIKLSKILIVFLAYYIIIFSFFIPQFKNSPDYSFLKTLIKIRFGIMNFFLVQFVYLFYLRSYKVFFSVFISSSIIILLIFLFSVISGAEILPLKVLDRRFISIERLLMLSYGLMPLLMSMGVVLLVFKFNIRYKKLILIGFILMSLTWILSLLRREIFGAIVLFLIAAIVNNYIYKKNLIPVKKFFLVSFQIMVLLFIINLSFPKYLEAVNSSIEQTYHVFKYGETLSGQKDTRLGFGKQELQEKIVKNYIVGTGFNNSWRVSQDAGFEASDYPFLSAIAMNGILGMLFFLPVYLILYKTIFNDLKYLRTKSINLNSFEYYFLIVLIIQFIFEILNYTYWFLPVSLFSHGRHHDWYIYLALFFVSRRVFYDYELSKMKSKLIKNK